MFVQFISPPWLSPSSQLVPFFIPLELVSPLEDQTKATNKCPLSRPMSKHMAPFFLGLWSAHGCFSQETNPSQTGAPGQVAGMADDLVIQLPFGSEETISDSVARLSSIGLSQWWRSKIGTRNGALAKGSLVRAVDSMFNGTAASLFPGICSPFRFFSVFGVPLFSTNQANIYIYNDGVLIPASLSRCGTQTSGTKMAPW